MGALVKCYGENTATSGRKLGENYTPETRGSVFRSNTAPLPRIFLNDGETLAGKNRTIGFCSQGLTARGSHFRSLAASSFRNVAGSSAEALVVKTALFIRFLEITPYDLLTDF